jgi:tRNA pseudouridine55 synthase
VTHRILGSIQTTTSMPRTVSPKLPLNGVFGIIKPSGPTSMAILDRLKTLIADSFLFVDSNELQKQRQNALDAKKPKGRGKFKNQGPKVGQGGTLDPLADGVLGK